MSPNEIETGRAWSDWYQAAGLTLETVTKGAYDAFRLGMRPEDWFERCYDWTQERKLNK